MSYYDLFRVAPDADGAEIAHAYRSLAKRYHPDRDPSPEALRRILVINRGYAILKHPSSRARYDEVLAEGREAASSGPAEGDAELRVVSRRPVPPPLPPSGRRLGSILDFGRYAGWSLGQVGAEDPDYLEWLRRSSGGRRYSAEIASIVADRAKARRDSPRARHRLRCRRS